MCLLQKKMNSSLLLLIVSMILHDRRGNLDVDNIIEDTVVRPRYALLHSDLEIPGCQSLNVNL